MPVIVAPYTPPPPPPTPRPPRKPTWAEQREPLQTRWHGWDDSMWDFNDPNSGISLQDGVRGLGMAQPVHYRDQSPALAGSRYRGTRVVDRNVLWPLRLAHSGSSVDMLDRLREFWRTMNPELIGTWEVMQPTGDARFLDLRYETGGDEPLDVDPLLFGYQYYVLTLTAEQPYWRGDPVTRFFPTSDPSTLGLNWTGPGVLNIFAGSSLQSATIPNPGDRPARITWTLTGPLDSARMGVGSKLIDVPFSLDDGETLTVYTAPDLMMAVDSGGVDRTRALGLGSNLTGEIPPGGEASLSVEPVWTAPGGSVTATLVPLYYMAF